MCEDCPLFQEIPGIFHRKARELTWADHEQS
jgi:hypothetical protein